jgi:hypothetical protein
VKLLDFEMIGQCEQIVGSIRSGAIRVGHGTAVATALVRNEPIAGACEGRTLMFPCVGAAGICMEKNDRHAATAVVLVKDLRAWNLDETLMKCRWL